VPVCIATIICSEAPVAAGRIHAEIENVELLTMALSIESPSLFAGTKRRAIKNPLDQSRRERAVKASVASAKVATPPGAGMDQMMASV